MSSLEMQCSGRRLPRQVFSGEMLTANIGAQVGIVSATTCPLRTVSGWSRAKTGVLPKYGFRVSTGPWRTSLYCGGLEPSIGRRMPIRAVDGVPKKSLKKPTSSVVVSVSLVEGFERLIDQATIFPSKGAS